MTRRRWVIATATAAAAGAGLDAFEIEPRRVTVTRHQMGSGEGPTVRVVQLTDLHLRSLGHHEERVAATVLELRPELILFTGDSIDRADALGLLDRFLGLLGVAVPKLAILGNWEHWGGVDVPQLRRIYERWNCQLLLNESCELALRGATLLVTGLDDLVGGTPDLRVAVARATPRPNHLLLAHCPVHRDLFPANARARIPIEGMSLPEPDPRLLEPQFMFAGHTHGGQIAPFGWAPLRPRGSGRYVKGWYAGDPTLLYVSRGLGTSIVPARFCAPPEVALFEWTLAPIAR